MHHDNEKQNDAAVGVILSFHGKLTVIQEAGWQSWTSGPRTV